MIRLLLLTMLLSACATSYRPKATGAEPFAFVLTPEQCEHLRTEQRDYRAANKASTYVSTSTAAVGAALLLIPALRDERAVQGATAIVGLIVGGTSVFTASQADALAEEI